METHGNGEHTAANIQYEEEHDNLARSTKKVKMAEGNANINFSESTDDRGQFFDCRRKSSYKDKVLGPNMDTEMGEIEDDDFEGNVSDDDIVEEDDVAPWFSMGMTKQEKIDARWLWRMCLIIRLVGRSVGCHFLHNHLQSLRKCQGSFILIDLTNDCYIAKFTKKSDYEGAMLNGPWVVSDHYLHVHRWEPNFMAKTATIDSLLVWGQISDNPC